MPRFWSRADTIRKLIAARRGIGARGWFEMIAGLAAVAIVLGFIERLF